MALDYKEFLKYSSEVCSVHLLDSVGEGEGWMLRENSMYIIYSETDHQPRWDA